MASPGGTIVRNFEPPRTISLDEALSMLTIYTGLGLWMLSLYFYINVSIWTSEHIKVPGLIIWAALVGISGYVIWKIGKLLLRRIPAFSASIKRAFGLLIRRAFSLFGRA